MTQRARDTIAQCQPSNLGWIDKPHLTSWLPGFLSQYFGDRVLFFPETHRDEWVGSSADIVWLDDESYTWTVPPPAHLAKFQASVVITSNQARWQQLQTLKIRSIWMPWLHWLYVLIPWRRLNRMPEPNTAPTKSFNFLNRRWQPGRLHMLEHIFKHRPELLDQGHITANWFDHYKDHPQLVQDQDFLKFFPEGGFQETNRQSLFGLECPAALNNVFYMSAKLPAKIDIFVDSDQPSDVFTWMISEKTMYSLAIEHLPLIVGGKPGRVSQIRQQGFDVFDDVLDHAYDTITDYHARLENCIDSNLDVLSGRKRLPDLQHRLESNQQHLLHTWLDSTLDRLLTDLEDLLQGDRSK